MSKILKKPVKGNKKVTDYFYKKTATSSPLSCSQPECSQATSQFTQSSNAPAPMTICQKTMKSSFSPNNRNIPLVKQDMISVSSGSAGHITVSSRSRSHITISSTSSVPAPAAGMHRQVMALDSSSSDIKVPAVRKSAASAKTSVRRAPQRNQAGSKSSRPLKRKFELDSDSDIPLIEKVPYPVADEGITGAGEPVSRPPSSLEPASSIPPLTPKDQLLSLPSDDAVSVVSISPSKRARLDTPIFSRLATAVSTAVSGNEADVEDVIPSSQSDERELMFRQIVKDPVQTMIEVDRWRQGTVAGGTSPTELSSLHLGPSELLMDVDMEMPVSESVTMDGSSSDSFNPPTGNSLSPSGGADSQTSEAEVSANLRRSKSASFEASQPATFALSSTDPKDAHVPARLLDDLSMTSLHADSPALPATPVALDTASKTRNVIDAIRANVAARVTSSPIPDAAIFRDELSSDDDLQFDDDIFGLASKEKGVGASEAQCSRSSSPRRLSPIPESRRYSLRRRSPAAGPGGEGSSYAANTLPRLVAVSDESRRASSSKKANPLDVLLREKSRVERRGGGSEALAAAEAAVASAAKNKAKTSRTFGPDNVDAEYADEDAAMRVVYERVHGQPRRRRSHTPHSSDDSDEDDVQIGAADYEKFLGDKGQVVGKIIERDRQGNAEEAHSSKQVRGVPLWLCVPPTSKRTSRREPLPSLPFESTDIKASPLLAAADAAVGRSDTRCAVLMLRPECIAMLPRTCRGPLFAWLYDLASRSPDPNIINSIFCTLEHLAGVCTDTSLLTHEQIIVTLIRLGAQPRALHVPESAGLKEPVDDDRRRVLLLHLTSLLVTLFRKHCLNTQEVPDIILSLLKIALDVTTSYEVQHQVPTVIDSMLANIENTDAGRLLETQIATHILEYMGGLQSLNRAYLLSFLNRGCSRNAHIARWVARGCLLRLHHAPLGNYSSLPSLHPLIPLLSPAVGSQAAFDIPGNMNLDNYFEDLRYNVEILNIALSDIESYVREEMKTRGLSRDGSVPSMPDSTRDERTQTELEAVKLALDKLHGKIADTRAAHLDRSRAKASLQQLSFRVHYQRQACLRSSNGTGVGKPRNIRGYFDTSTKTT